MKFIITGATSFIGLEFTKLVLECGHDVFAVCREGSKSLEKLPKDPSLSVFFATMDEYEMLPSKIDSADIFVNFAWDGTNYEGRTKTDIHKKNIENTKIAFRIAKEIGCRLFVESGSQAEYGVYDGLIDENTPCNPFTEYGKGKLAMKQEGFKLSEEIDLKYLHLRIFSTFGEGDHPYTLFMNAVSKMLNNEPLDLSPCTQKWNFLYSRDAVKQIYYLCEKAVNDDSFKHEVFNLASEDTRILKDYVVRLKVLLHSESQLNYGVFTPEHLVTLNPNISKLKNYIGFVASYSFDEAAKLTAQRIQKDTEMNKTNSNEGYKCLVCGSPLENAETLFVCDNMPGSAQDIPTKEELPNDKGIQLKLVQCKCCGLVQIPTEPVHYYKKVIRAGGGTTTMVNLRNEQYTEFMNRFNLKGKKILEVGCGKGEFLRIWKDYDVRAVGIEYDQELVTRARNEGMEVYKAYADDADTKLPEAPYDAFVQFNFLEHQPYPNDMLQCIYNNLTEDGVGLVTVPSLEYILKYDGYYELIKDHIAYYSEETLKFLFQKNGFEVVDCHTVNRDTHSIMVRKRKKADVSSWKENFDSLKQELFDYVNGYVGQGKKVAVWGASHQGFTLIPSLGLSDKIAYIIDSAPFKQGKYAPASHIPIVDRKHYFEEPVASILIVAPGYTDEIANIIKTELSADIDIRTLRSNHLEKI
jgi:nucleoside-diphosphate-sugar epimerase/SAM-dependent methyltransferase